MAGTRTEAAVRQRVSSRTAVASSVASRTSSRAPETGAAYQAPIVDPESRSPPGLIRAHGTCRQAHHLVAWSSTITTANRDRIIAAGLVRPRCLAAYGRATEVTGDVRAGERRFKL